MASSGWVEERGKGKWRLNVNYGTNEDGSRKVIRETVKAKNRDGALRQLGLLIKRIEKGEYIEPSKQTFKAFVEKWLSAYAEKTLAPKTVYRYKQLLDSRIIPAMGHLKIDQIKPIHLVSFYSNLTEDGIREDGRKGGLSERTILHHHRLISTILQTAVEWQVIVSNPASRISPPKVHKKTGNFYNEDQTRALLDVVETEDIKHKALIYLAVFCGLRCGEIMGLEWQDINFEDSTLTVRQASQYLPGKGAFTKEPKNESSQRTISLPLRVLNVLTQHKAKQDEAAEKMDNLWKGSNRVFTTRDGKPAHPEWPSQWFPKFLKRNKLAPLPFHGLRHTAATIMISQGADVKNLSSRLGHANTSTTLNIYSHALKTVDKDIADKTDAYIDKLLTKEQEEPNQEEQKPVLTVVK
ncbi:tyrosine-type recombinase/integrase [Pelotomaculum sp. PtaB.Bin117]|uniref:tyrosine-type recombinase/integrase n=1 Tax=Pelotomaculum sp. PtaB.Bin117 TaxID=1811694 RepID=UPI0009C8D217|nr:tyrosine-type recombinase/integrase [Pelotomaculum sp. PtaB.Bin117]OPX85728.1 MAG: putative prophage phiRv2 integrase [Pelotomaculum sp. PtaB.Bin117]